MENPYYLREGGVGERNDNEKSVMTGDCWYWQNMYDTDHTLPI